MPCPSWRKPPRPEINIWPTFSGMWNYGRLHTRTGYPPWRTNSGRHCDQDPATRNATGASGTTCMEKPHPADQPQCPISPLATSGGKPATPKPGTDAPTTETSSGTYNARNEAAAGATQAPRIPKATSTRARSRARRKSPLDTTRIVSGTSFGPAILTIPTTFPAPPLSFAT